MVQVRGPRLSQLRDADDRYTNRMLRSVRNVLRVAADNLDQLDPVDSLGVIVDEWRVEVNDNLLPELGDVWRDAADDTLARLQDIANRLAQGRTASLTFQSDLPGAESPPPPSPGAFNVPRAGEELAEAYLATRSNHLVNVGNEVWEIARGQLLDGMRQSESIPELRDRVTGSVEFSQGRATAVARTEVVGASNAGSIDQMIASGVSATKEWLATNDSRTRDTHASADGQMRDLREPFNVGGFDMPRPHEGPAQEVVNCRCTMTYEVAEEGLMPEGEASILAAVESEEHTSAMIALVPSDDDLDRLTLEDGEPRDELHLTVAFLGDADQFDNKKRARMVDEIKHQLSHFNDMSTIIRGTAFGVNYWNPQSDDPAWVLAVGERRDDDDDDLYRSLTLTEVYGLVLEALDEVAVDTPEQFKPWVPHVTIMYGNDTSRISELEERLGDVAFDRVRLAFGSDVRDVSLKGDPVTLSSSGGSVMPFSKVQDHADCPTDSPWAVVNDDTGEVEGCHATEEEADDQLAALNIAEAEEEENASSELDVTTAANENENILKLFQSEIVDLTVGRAWEGVIVVEGITTGDGREFAPGALTWGELPIPLRRNIEDSHGGDLSTTKAVLVGRIDEIERVGNQIIGRGVFDLGGEHGMEAKRLVEEGFLKGISVDIDDISDADVELIFPDEESADDEDDILFLMPEKILFHAGRIRAATLVDIPAFIEAEIELIDDTDEDGESRVASATAKMFGAVASHSTATSDDSWDGPANERRLPSPMTVEKARDAYAWIESDRVEDGEIVKDAARFIHHEVNADGDVGAANLTACSTGIAVLNGARGGTTIPAADRQGVWNHLARHLRDADREPPPLQTEAETIAASASVFDDRPPAEWFANPNLSLPTPITITDAGRVYGHAAMWGECHVGNPDVCVTAPHEDSHPYYMTGEVVCNNGDRVAVGQVTVGTGHAPLHVTASRAAEHYDNTGSAVADVTIGNDAHGIWIAGSIRPDADAARVRDLRAAGQVSGDWRRIGGQLRLVGLLAVNVPGFPVPKLATRVASGAPLALVAAGRPIIARPVETEEQMTNRALRHLRDQLARRVLGGN